MALAFNDYAVFLALKRGQIQEGERFLVVISTEEICLFLEKLIKGITREMVEAGLSNLEAEGYVVKLNDRLRADGTGPCTAFEILKQEILK